MNRKKVSELAKQIRGVSYKTEDLHENLDENSVTLLRANNIFEGRINFDDVVYVDKSRVAREQYLCKGDILVCASSGSKQLVGKAASFNFDTECTFGAFCKVVRPNQDVANYLSMYFQSNAYRRKISEVAIGANINNIRNEHIDALELPIGSNAENEKVVAPFSLLQQIIDGRKQQLHKLDELIKARFVEMFGDVIRNSKSWEIRVLADIASSRLGKMLDTKQQTGECSYPYLANFNVQWFRFNTENLNQMDFNEEDRIEFELQNGDLLVCEGGEIGRCAVWHNEIQPCFFQKALHRVRCNRQIVHPDYLGWWFKYNCDHDGFATIAGAKATIAHLPGVKLKQLRVAIPPLELQEQFAAFVNQTDKSKAVIQKALDETQLLFDSLMQEYFG